MDGQTMTFFGTLISALVTLAVCVITNRAAYKKTEALIAYRLEQVEKRLDKHNNLVERTFKLEEQNAIQDERIRNLEKAR